MAGRGRSPWPARLRVVLVTMLAASVLANEARAQDPPPELTGAVNDFAGILDESARQQIARSRGRTTRHCNLLRTYVECPA